MKRIHAAIAIALMVALTLGAGLSHAEAPTTISYQGRITNAAGDPVVDGSYNIDFRLYDADVGGIEMWAEPGVIVNTVEGLFNTVLGTPTPFPQNFGSANGSPFGLMNTELWLEIEVNGQIQTPRTQLHAVPYAQVARDLAGKSTSGSGIRIETNSEAAVIQTFGNNGAPRFRMAGNNWTEFKMWDGADSLGVHLTTFFTNGAELYLYKPNSANQVILSSAAPGDNSAVLLDDAVNAQEMLNEPGIALARLAASVTLTPSNTSQDILSVSITIPTSGYIVLDGTMYHTIRDSGATFAWVQISETSSAGLGTGSFNWTGANDYGNNLSSYIYYSTPVKEVHFKSAGTYTFYLQGNLYSNNTTLVIGSAYSPSWLQATFYPTSYGTVESIAASPGDHPEASALQVEDPMTGQSRTGYTMDLRYYELRAQQLRNELLQNELEMEAARRANMSSAGSPSGVQQ